MRMIADDPAIILMKVVETGRVRITAKVDYAVRAAVQLAAAEGAGPVKADAIEAWANQLADFHVVLPVDASIYRRWARLMHGKPDHHQTDGLIAATALVNGLTVVTRNVKDFKPFGVALINPFQYGR